MKIPVKHNHVTTVGYLMLRINNPYHDNILSLIRDTDLAEGGLEEILMLLS